MLHHTTIAHELDVALVPRLIRIGRERLSEKGVRSAEKAVSPLNWFTDLSCAQVAEHMQKSFERQFQARASVVSAHDLRSAESLVGSKYATRAWIDRLS